VYSDIAYSTDGATWMKVANSPFSYRTYSIAYGDGKFVAGGTRGKVAYSTDGATWTAVANSTFSDTADINDIAYGGGKFVAVGDNGEIAYFNNQE
jgi:hypothetical protein